MSIGGCRKTAKTDYFKKCPSPRTACRLSGDDCRLAVIGQCRQGLYCNGVHKAGKDHGYFNNEEYYDYTVKYPVDFSVLHRYILNSMMRLRAIVAALHTIAIMAITSAFLSFILCILLHVYRAWHTIAATSSTVQQSIVITMIIALLSSIFVLLL